jgi:hypothetical protein
MRLIRWIGALARLHLFCSWYLPRRAIQRSR